MYILKFIVFTIDIQDVKILAKIKEIGTEIIMNQVNNLPGQYRIKLPAGNSTSFRGRETPISSRTASNISTGAFIGNMFGTSLIGIPLFARVSGLSKILNENSGMLIKDAAKIIVKNSPLKVASGIACAIGATLLTAFAGAKVALKLGKGEKEDISNKTLLKLSGASMVGSTVGSWVGSIAASMVAGVSIIPLLVQSIFTVVANDKAVYSSVKKHNQALTMNSK